MCVIGENIMHRTFLLSLALIATPVFGQIMYKCPASGKAAFKR